MRYFFSIFILFASVYVYGSGGKDYVLVLNNKTPYQFTVDEELRDEKGGIVFKLVQFRAPTEGNPEPSSEEYRVRVQQNEDGDYRIPNSDIVVRHLWSFGSTQRALTLYIR